MRYITYDDTGLIHQNGTIRGFDGDITEIVPNSMEVEQAVDAEIYYVNGNGLIVERPENPSKLSDDSVEADSLSTVHLTTPVGSVVKIPRLQLEWDNVSSVQLIFDEPGVYLIRVNSFPLKTQELYINAI